jgi:hypothetical protein
VNNNEPLKTTPPVSAPISAGEWRAEGHRRFGPHLNNWRFICPSCGHEAAVYDWKKAGAPEGAIAYSCVGNFIFEEELQSARSRSNSDTGPCNWTGGGPVRVVTPDEARDLDPKTPDVMEYFGFGAPTEYEQPPEVQTPSDTIEIPDELYYYIDAHDDDELSDAVWFQALEDSVAVYNQEHGTTFDANDAVHAYVERRSEENKEGGTLDHL